MDKPKVTLVQMVDLFDLRNWVQDTDPEVTEEIWDDVMDELTYGDGMRNDTPIKYDTGKHSNSPRLDAWLKAAGLDVGNEPIILWVCW